MLRSRSKSKTRDESEPCNREQLEMRRRTTIISSHGNEIYGLHNHDLHNHDLHNRDLHNHDLNNDGFYNHGLKVGVGRVQRFGVSF